MKKHSEARPYQCDVCLKGFKWKSHLNRHNLIHQGIRFQCHICTRPFNDKSNLTKHLSVHSGESTCPYCLIYMKNQSSLNYHIKSHHISENKFQCPSCPLTFRTRARLKSHSHVHDELVCPHCPSTFYFKRSLTTHLRIVHQHQKIKTEAC